jgi:hypothetical protein
LTNCVSQLESGVDRDRRLQVPKPEDINSLNHAHFGSLNKASMRLVPGFQQIKDCLLYSKLSRPNFPTNGRDLGYSKSKSCRLMRVKYWWLEAETSTARRPTPPKGKDEASENQPHQLESLWQRQCSPRHTARNNLRLPNGTAKLGCCG